MKIKSFTKQELFTQISAWLTSDLCEGDFEVDGIYVGTYNPDECDNGGYGFVIDGCWYGEYDNKIDCAIDFIKAIASYKQHKELYSYSKSLEIDIIGNKYNYTEVAVTAEVYDRCGCYCPKPKYVYGMIYSDQFSINELISDVSCCAGIEFYKLYKSPADIRKIRLHFR